jgi:predicted metal-dependent peptidase
MSKEVHTKVSEAVCDLIVNMPFFGIFLSSTNIFQDTSLPTAGTDGTRIYYNPKFFAQLSQLEIKGVLIHEVLHICYSHCSKKRRGFRDKRKWNKSADFVINLEINAMSKDVVKLPHNITIDKEPFKCLIDEKYKGMYVEQVYDLLPDNDKGDSFDVHIDMVDDENISQDIEDRMITAHDIAKMDDKVPGGVARMVDEIRKARVPWNRVLLKYINSALTKDDYSYARPNRRYVGQDLYLPSLIGYKVANAVIAIDTSGSISQQEISAFANEIRKISGLVSEVIVMSCDAAVHSYEVVRDMSNFDKAIKKIGGGGGTDFKPAFLELKKRRITPDVFIYLTDLEGSFPEKNTIHYPVIWVSTTTKIAPFGITIQMRL